MAYFPVFIDLSGREILVVGGGPIAARRIRVLREFGCRILAVAPEAATDIKEMEKETPEAVRWLQGTYEKTDPLGNGRPPPDPPPFSFWRPPEPESIKRWCGTAVFWGSRSMMHQKRKTAAFIFRGSQKHGEAVAGVISGGGDHRLAAVLSEAVRKAVDAVMENMDQEGPA